MQGYNLSESIPIDAKIPSKSGNGGQIMESRNFVTEQSAYALSRIWPAEYCAAALGRATAHQTLNTHKPGLNA